MNGTSVTECQEKLESVLKVFLQPKCRIKNDVYLEMLLSHLSSTEEYKNIVRSDAILEWIEKIVIKFTDEDISPPIVAFTLRLLALVIENEWTFSVIKEKQILEKIQKALNENKKLQTASIKLANVLLLSSIAQYSIGLHWIKQTKSWQTVSEYCQKNHTLYVVRDAMKFLFNILHKYSTLLKDEQLTDEILIEIFLPLTICTTDSNNIIAVDDSDLQQKIAPTLNLICYILHRSIELNDCKKITYYILENLKIELTMWRLADMTHDHLFLEQVFRLFVLCNFARLKYIHKPKTSELDFNCFSLNFFNCMNFCIARRSSMNVFKMAELNHIVWKLMGTNCPEEIMVDHECIKFEDQFLILQILPILHFIKRENTKGKEWLENYLLNLFNISSEHTTRLCYSFRELMRTIDNVNDLACKSIQSILSLKNILHRDRAILVFQALVFTLKGYSPDMCYYVEPKPDTPNTDILTKNPNLLSAILTGLHTLISHYKITWKECIESTTLLNFMLALLNDPNMLSRQSVHALKLTQLSIEHFLAPNLALLVDTLTGSGMELLGPMIMKRLHDKDWETRDSTIELVVSMVTISDLKFPAFQQHILDNGICPIIVSMAKNDSEAYVRASALKCLSEMIKIKLFWDRCLGAAELCTHLIVVLGSESEGVVRREAVELITVLYDQQKISRNCLDHIFSVIAYCSVNDLYWEVKTSAIKFWKVVICRQCKHQGMIDGTFPAVTFSIEYKKIVTLNEKEILLRIKKVLDELSLRGCLGVFLMMIDDDECDLEVVRSTVKLIKKLLLFLNKYNYMENHEKIFVKPNNHIPVVDTNYSEFKRETININQFRNNADSSGSQTNSKEALEKIIDSIVDTDDVNLLANAYENQLNVNLTETKIDEQYYKKFTVLPGEFLDKITSIDLDDLIKMKSDWITQAESFSSLLDDILLSFQNLEHTDADCY